MLSNLKKVDLSMSMICSNSALESAVTSCLMLNLAVSISVSVGLNESGIVIRNLSTNPWPCSILAINLAAFLSCVDQRKQNGVFNSIILGFSVE